MYYFPEADESSTQDRARAFVYKVRDHPRDATRQVIEIVVDRGRDLTLADIRVDVSGDKLVISGDRPRWRAAGARSSSREDDRSASGTDDERQLIKQFTLPKLADVDAITSRRADDGRLAILVPVRR